VSLYFCHPRPVIAYDTANDGRTLEGLDSGTLQRLAEKLAPFASRGETRAPAPDICERYQFKVSPTGLVELTVPACVGEIEAMKEINRHFCERYPEKNRAAIWEDDLDWYAKQEGVKVRDLTQKRHIELQGVVPGTRGKTRAAQANVLAKNDMAFTEPEALALAAAPYEYKTGKDLLQDLWVRTRAPGVALLTYPYGGVLVDRDDDVYVIGGVAAGGSPNSKA